MTATLPSELWLCIFSYLDLEDLRNARQVCKTWSELINCDLLWKPRLLARGVSLDCMKLDDGEHEHEEGVSNRWVQLGLTYYGNLASNWGNLNFEFSTFPRSTAGVAMQMPFVVWTFKPSDANFVEVLRVVNGEMAKEARLPLPIRGAFYTDDSCSPCMTFNNVFAVTMNVTIIIFKLKDGKFSFAKAIEFTGSGSCFSTKDTEVTPRYIFEWNESRTLPMCSSFCVTDDVIWFQAIRIEEGEPYRRTMYVWNYNTSTLLLNVEVRNFIGSSKDYAFLMTKDEGFSIYSLNGNKIWSEASEVTSVCWNNFGCAFIEIGGYPSVKAKFLELPKATSTKNIDVPHAVAITLHKTGHFAFCLRLEDNTARMNCISLRNGGILWDIVAFPIPTPSPVFSTLFCYKLDVVLGKYITLLGMDDSLMVGEWNKLHVYTTSRGKKLGTINIKPLYELQHLSDEFMLAGTSEHNGDWEFRYELYNFLFGKDTPDEPIEAMEP
uniref:F-box domain-containing protein n=2 Tax=Lygus hesperus TaxID=30085 RepID=A0A146L2I1_LYGHE